MNASIIAAKASGTPTTAVASTQEVTAGLHNDAHPSAASSFSERESWCDTYVWSLIGSALETPLPDGVRPTHHFEVELNACKLDPLEYARQTRFEPEPTPKPSKPSPE